MNKQKLIEQIELRTSTVFDIVFNELKAVLCSKGLPSSKARLFTIFITIREEIEDAVISSMLNPGIKTDVVDDMLEKYAFLRSPRTEFFPRQCSITKQPMSEGWVVYEDTYISSEAELIKLLRSNSEEPEIDNALTDDELRDKYYEKGTHYYTEWRDLEDIEFAVLDGQVYSINE